MKIFAADALTPRMARDVRIDIDAGGVIASVHRGARPRRRARRAARWCPACRISIRMRSSARSPVAPERRRRRRQLLDVARGDVRFLERVDADAFEAIAAQAYVEMLKAGYTSRGRIPLRPSRSPGQALRRSRRARAAHRGGGRRPASGSRCCRSSTRTPDFGGAPPTAGQRRFVHTLDVLRARSSKRSRATRRARLDARRRAAQPARGHAGGARSDRCARAAAARRSTSMPPSSAGSRRVHRLERRAAGRVAARPAGLDARWCSSTRRT